MAQVLLQKEHAAPPVKPRPEILCPVDPKLEAPSLPSSSLLCKFYLWSVPHMFIYLNLASST